MSARLVGWVPGSGRLDREIGASTRVGATPDNDVVVRVDGVSRLHARIVEQPDGYWLEDAGSRNGTWLNGERTTRAKLRHLDVITLGRFAELIFVARAAGAVMPDPPPPAQVRLEWLNGPSQGDSVEIPRGETILGRAESCGIVMQSSGVSRAHARLTHTGESVMLEDLGSANGTTVNGQPLTGPVALDPGAEIDLGQDRRFRILFEPRHDHPTPASAQAATPIAAQDMEWATRLVWPESDLQAVRADLARGAPTPPATPPAAKPPMTPERRAPAAPVPAAKGGPPAQTEPGAFESGQPPPVEGPRVDRTQIGAPPSLGTGLEPAQAGAQPGGTAGPAARRDPERSQATVGRSDPAPPTVLGHRDVAPMTRVPTFADQNAERTRAPADSGLPLDPPTDETTAPIESVRLSGDVGVFVLSRGTATVGRSEKATVRIDSRDVSRIHAILTISDRDVVVEDRGSVNGTTVNGVAVNGRAPLVDGDRVSFADFEFRIEVHRTEATS